MTSWVGSYLRPEDMVPGLQYFVKFQDCCVEGEFTACYVGSEDPEFGPWVFDNSLTISGMAISFYTTSGLIDGLQE